MFEFKEGGNYNRMNTLKYFEDYNFCLTQKSGKLAICGWTLESNIAGRSGEGNHIPDIGKTGHKLDQPLKTQAEPRMGN